MKLAHLVSFTIGTRSKNKDKPNVIQIDGCNTPGSLYVNLSCRF